MHDSARDWGQESACLRSRRLFTEQCPLTDMLLQIDNTAKIVVNILLLHWLLQQFYKCIWIYICIYFTSFTWQAIYWWLCMTFLLLHIKCWQSVSPVHHKPAHIFFPIMVVIHWREDAPDAVGEQSLVWPMTQLTPHKLISKVHPYTDKISLTNLHKKKNHSVVWQNKIFWVAITITFNTVRCLFNPFNISKVNSIIYYKHIH